jgi:hypothetical protein
MRRAYKFMLLLYPRGHRDQFAEEMLSVFEEAFDERRAHRWSWSVRFAFAEVTGLIGGAAGAWFDGKPAPEVPTASTLPHELIEAQRRVDLNVAGMVQAIANHQFERARALSNQEREARENLRVQREKYGISDPFA